MTKYGVLSSKATSLQVVGKDIVYALEKHGVQAEFYDCQITHYHARAMFDRAIIVIPFDPLVATPWFLLQRDYSVNGIPSVTYVTTEGEPKKWLVRPWMKRDCTFIANSSFTERMLLRIGVEVKKVVPHGVNLQLIKHIMREKRKIKEELKKKLNAKVVYGTVASELPRKGLNKLAEAIRIIEDKIEDAKFYIITTSRGKAYFTGLKNVYVSATFGKHTRDEILRIIASFDYYICSSLAEGFCLPVLEAQALGVPVIYPDYDPLNEITHPTANFPIPVIGEEYRSQDYGILFLLRDYDPAELAKRIEETHHIYTCDGKKYRMLSKQVSLHAEKFDCVKTYRDFLTI